MIKLSCEQWYDANESALWSFFCEMSPLTQEQWTPMEVSRAFTAWCFKRYQKYLED